MDIMHATKLLGRDGLISIDEPCEVCKMPDERVARAKTPHELIKVSIVVTLGKTPPIRSAYEGHMPECGSTVAKDMRKMDLLGRRAQKIDATDNLSDAHEGVINHNGKLIGDGPV